MANKKPETTVTFSWIATLKYMAIGIFVGALGLLMWQADVALIRLIGVVAIVAGCGLVVTLPFTGGVHTAPCPVCGTEIEVMMKSGRYLKCTNCLEYFEAADRTLRQMDETHVADEPRFEVRLPWWDDLHAPTGATITIGGPQDYVSDRLQEAIFTRRIPDRTVSASWPKACCVCGSTPTRYEALAQQVNVGPEGVGGVRDRNVIVRVEGIPYCDQHEKGATFSTSPGECGRLLIFRSYAYRNEFRRVNPWPIAWS